MTNLAAPVDELLAAVLDDRVAPQIAAEITASLVVRPRAEIEEALRRRRANLGDALIHRIESSGNDIEARGWFAHSLSIWDPERGDPILARETRRGLTPGNYSSESVVLTERRIERNDPYALVDYAGWLLTLPPTRNVDELFSIVADHQIHPKITLAANWVFRVGSPWLAVDDEFADRMRSLLQGKAISIPALNLSIETALADHRVIGNLKTIVEPPPPRTSKLADGYDDRGFVLDLGRSVSWSMNRSTAQLHGVAIGQTDVSETQLRVADFYAWMLTGNDGAPDFNPTWSIERRDAAIAKITRWAIRQRGTWRAPPEKLHLIF